MRPDLKLKPLRDHESSVKKRQLETILTSLQLKNSSFVLITSEISAPSSTPSHTATELRQIPSKSSGLVYTQRRAVHFLNTSLDIHNVGLRSISVTRCTFVPIARIIRDNTSNGRFVLSVLATADGKVRLWR